MGKTMKMITVSIWLGALSLVCLLLVMLALQDIFSGRETSLVTEWRMVRIGIAVLFLYNIVALITLIRVRRKPQSEAES